MARPKGFRLSAQAFDDALRFSQTSITEASKRSGLPRATVSSLVGGFHRASLPQAEILAGALDVHVETLFPTLDPHFEEVTP